MNSNEHNHLTVADSTVPAQSAFKANLEIIITMKE